MQEAVLPGQGAMAVLLGLSDEKVIEACQQASSVGVVEAVNFNSPGQIVIAGETLAVDKTLEIAKQMGAKRGQKLPVSVPSHCQLMKPAADALSAYLAGVIVQSPKIPVMNNVDVKCNTDPEEIRDAVVRQLYCPVRWTQTIEVMASEGIDTVIECGPGKVLSGLNKRIKSDLHLFNLCELDAFSV
jgi:[acyl-carrier-protein] S-malonyltransferase